MPEGGPQPRLTKREQKASRREQKRIKREDAATMNRRKFLKLGAGAVVGAVASGYGIHRVVDALHQQQDAPYRNLENTMMFSNDQLKQIAEDLQGQTEYPGIRQGGNLLMENQQNPSSVTRYDATLLRQDKPIAVGFANLGFTRAAFENEIAARSVEITLQRRDSSEQVRFMAAEPEKNKKTDVKIILHQELKRQGSANVKRLLITKEISHLLYFAQARARLRQEFNEKFETPLSAQLEDMLVATTIFVDDLHVPPILDSVTNFVLDIDCAGYWHMLPDFGKMKATGKLTAEDLYILDSNNEAFEKAKKAGFLLPDPNQQNGFKWREDVGPFHPEWLAIARPLIQGHV